MQPRPKLGRWKGELERMLIANAAVTAREQLTLIRVFEELRAQGYEGGYDAVRRYVRTWAKDHAAASAAAFVPLSFASGEQLRIEKIELPVKRLVDLQARNDECRSRGFSASSMVPLSETQRLFGYF